MKTCNKCLQSLAEDHFGKYKTKSKGFISTRTRNRCKSCRSHDEKQRYSLDEKCKERSKKRAREYHFKVNYDLTLEELNRMIEERSNLCDICKEQMPTPNVDHNHMTGKVRGLLCWGCNIGLGKFKDNISSLKRAINYLEVQN